MTGSTRRKGSARIKGTKLALTLGAPGVDYWADISSYALEPEDADSDVTTFEDAGNGGAVQYKLTGTATQSTDEDSFWDYVWENTGAEVPFTLAPHGNESPTAAQPHFVGIVKVGRKPKLGGEAGTSSFTFDFEWKLEGDYVKDRGE